MSWFSGRPREPRVSADVAEAYDASVATLDAARCLRAEATAVGSSLRESRAANHFAAGIRSGFMGGARA